MKAEFPFATGVESQLMPTNEVNVRIATRRNITVLISSAMIALEVAVYAVLFWGLYHYRVSVEFRKEFDWFDPSNPRFIHYAAFFAISMLLFLFFVYRYKIFNFRSQNGLADELGKLAAAATFSILITIGISFLLKYNDYSRVVIVSYWLTSIAASVVIRFGKRKIYFAMANQGVVSRNVIIVGAGKIGRSLIEELEQQKWLGYKVLGFVDDSYRKDIEGAKYLGGIEQLKALIRTSDVEEIIITIPSERGIVRELINEFRKLNLRIKIIPDMYNLVTSAVQIGNINALPVVTLVKTPMRGMALAVKRLFDLAAASLLLVVMSPVLLVIVLLIKSDSPGPVLFRQERIGKDGKVFHMYKFRSMVQNAEELLPAIGHKNEMDGIAFKIKNDPRVTRIGKVLRKYSLDELPQLLNVIRGNMSLVGPRPPLPYEVDHYGDWEWRRLEVLPGITGLWQVSGRSNLSFQQWINLDIYYIENWSFVLDLKILLKTVPVVIKGEGAY